jgi:hypothetical protein
VKQGLRCDDGVRDEYTFVRAKARSDRDIPDPKNLPLNKYAAIRNLIETKVTALLANLRNCTEQ